MIQETVGSSAVRAGDFIMIGGQLPLDTETGVYEQTLSALSNLEKILAECDLTLAYVLRTVVYMTDLNQMEELEKAWKEKFSDPLPARSVVGVNSLPNNASVMIEGFAIDTRALEIICSKEGCGSCSNTCGI